MAGALRVFAEDVDLLGTSLYTYSKNVVSEVLTVGRAGTLVDWEGDGEQRGYVVRYAAEQILNWRVARVNGRNLVTLVVLSEVLAAGNAADDFDVAEMKQLRVLRLATVASATAKGKTEQRYVVEIWRRQQPKDKRRK